MAELLKPSNSILPHSFVLLPSPALMLQMQTLFQKTDGPYLTKNLHRSDSAVGAEEPSPRHRVGAVSTGAAR